MFRRDKEKDGRDSSEFIETVENFSARNHLLRICLLCALLNLAIWIAVFSIPEQVYYLFVSLNEISQKLSVAALSIPLWLTFLMTYAILRLKFPEIEDHKRLESNFMGSFNYQSHSVKRWRIWIAALLAGVLDTFLLVLATLFLNT